MAQGDVHFFDDTAERMMKGEYPRLMVSKLSILLVDNSRAATINDTGVMIEEFTSARSADAPAAQVTYIENNAMNYTWVPGGDLRRELNVFVESAEYTTVQVYIDKPLYPRTPGLTNVYQAILFDKDSGACFGFVDLTSDGSTPFNLDWEPLRIHFTGTSDRGLLFQTEISETGTLRSLNGACKQLLFSAPFSYASDPLIVYVGWGVTSITRNGPTPFKRPWTDLPPQKNAGYSLTRSGAVVTFDVNNLRWSQNIDYDHLTINAFYMRKVFDSNRSHDICADWLSWGNLENADQTYTFDSRGVYTCELVRP